MSDDEEPYNPGPSYDRLLRIRNCIECGDTIGRTSTGRCRPCAARRNLKKYALPALEGRPEIRAANLRIRPQTHEERVAAGRKGWAASQVAVTDAERSEFLARAREARTSDVMQRAARTRISKMSPEERKACSERMLTGVTDEMRRAALKKAHEALTPELRAAHGARLVEYVAALSPEERSDRIRRARAATPAERKTQAGRQAALSRESTHWLEWKGERHPIAEWARITGISTSAIRQRLGRGWSIERSLTTPERVTNRATQDGSKDGGT